MKYTNGPSGLPRSLSSFRIFLSLLISKNWATGSSIDAETANGQDKTKFYTSLYHALLGRGLASDVNGAYPAHNGTTGQIQLDKAGKPLYNHYNTDAVWGAY